MYNIIYSQTGRQLCMQTSWDKGHNHGFKDFESFEKHCHQMIVESGSSELTVYDSASWTPVAYIAVSLVGSYHRNGHGLSVDVSAVHKDHEGNKVLAKFIMKSIKRLALQDGCSWYERSKHINPSVIQTIIKEI